MRRPNIILVTLDTMRADRLRRVSGGRDLAPNLVALAANGLEFTRAVASGVPTYFSFPVLFRGGNALDGGKRIGLRDGAPTFVERLRDAGYSTAAVVASNPYLSRYYSYDRGFDVFDDFRAAGSGSSRSRVSRAERLVGREATTRLRHAKSTWNNLVAAFGDGNPSLHDASRGEAVTRRALELLDRLEPPFFLWLHYMDLHGYYYSTPEDRARALGARNAFDRMALRWKRLAYLSRWTGLILASEAETGPTRVDHTEEDRRVLEGFYDASVAYTDRALGPLLDAARGRGDTVSVVTSDHGEEFFEHGRLGHAPFSLYEEVVRVPLIVSGPDVPIGTRDDWVSHGRLAATMLTLAGLDADGGLLASGPAGPVLTESLWGLTTPFPREHLSEFNVVVSAREGDLKLISWEGADREELYDLGRDPAETRDLSGESRGAERAATLRDAVKTRVREASIEDARFELERRMRGVRSALKRRARGSR